MIDFGLVRPGTTLYIPFATYDSNDPSASVTLTGLATTDIEIYKNGSVTQRASDAGYALLDTDGIDFDGVTGIHGFSIDLADNSDAGFYAAGAQYWVVVASVTVDAGTVNFVAATFRLGLQAAVLNTTIATLSTQTSFTLTAGPAEDDALNGCIVYMHDVASAVQGGYAIVSDYTGSTKTVTLVAGTTFTAAATDHISVFPPDVAYLRLGAPAGASVSADVAAIKVDTAATLLDTGTDGVVVAAGSKTGYSLTATTGMGNQTADITGNLSGSVGNVTGLTAATVHSDLDDIQARLPAALTAGGNMKADTLAIDGSTAAATDLKTSALTIVRGTAITGTLSTTQMTTDLTEATDDHYNGRRLLWSSGVLTDQATAITDYTGATKLLTFTAVTEAPSNNDTFIIV